MSAFTKERLSRYWPQRTPHATCEKLFPRLGPSTIPGYVTTLRESAALHDVTALSAALTHRFASSGSIGVYCDGISLSIHSSDEDHRRRQIEKREVVVDNDDGACNVVDCRGFFCN